MTPMRLREPLRSAGDRGMTLIEIVVAMGIFSVVLAVSAVGIRQMMLTLNRTVDIGDSTVEVQRAFNAFDRELRYADAVAVPGTAADGTTWYVEYRMPAYPAAGRAVAECVQWRLNATKGILQRRTWPATATSIPSASEWEGQDEPPVGVVASRVTNDPATDQPFKAYGPGGTEYIYPRLRVELLSARNGEGVEMRTTFVARNAPQNSGLTADLCSLSGYRPIPSP